MSWEQPPQPDGARRWMWPAAGVVVVIAAIIVTVLSQQRTSGTLAIAPSAAPDAQEEASAAADPSDFVPERLDPLETASERAGGGPLLPDAPDVTIVTTDEQELRTIDIATGDIVRKRLMVTGPTFGIDPWTLFTVNGRVITNDGNHVVRIDHDLERTRVARRHRALYTADDASVWVLDDGLGSAPTASRLRFDGTIADRVELPAVVTAHVGTAEGVLVTSPGGIHLASGDGVRRITASGQLITASADRLAWLDCAANLSCQVVAGTFDDPDQVRIPLERTDVPGYYGPTILGFSPDGRLLALPVFRIETAGRVATVAVVIIDTAAGAVVDRIQPRSSAGYSGVPLAWSPDGRWLFMALNGRLNAWSAETRALTEIDVSARQVLGLAVVER